MATRQLDVLIDGEPVGALREENDPWTFEYAANGLSEASFDVSPALLRHERVHTDGATSRTVQWYVDNSLPEEALRGVLAREAHINADDAFGLLAHYGAESAGALVLQSPDDPSRVETGLRPLPLAALNKRIANLPRESLTLGAAKRMSLAGAQRKLLVVLRDDELFEPLSSARTYYEPA